MEDRQRGVAAVMVMDVQPERERDAAFGLKGGGAGVGPFVKTMIIVNPSRRYRYTFLLAQIHPLGCTILLSSA
ncbi:hypothetical protein GCM10022214_39860 [Actinomadura miaoliensis]|uniref:Uncharacterized protein n=1 Tax=Actinomadura miaoliensis TaxID=430685 RepID=A0ABP7VZV0_9ACTN